MSPSSPVLFGSLVLLLAAPLRADEPPSRPTTFVEHVAPILDQSCTYCHDAADPSGGLDLSSYGALLQGGSSGAVVSPGDPEGSRLLRLVTGKEKPFMPQDGGELAPEAVAALRRWIAEGALEVAGGAPPPRARAGLSLGPPSSAAVSSALPLPLPLGGVPLAARAPSVLALAASPVAPLLAVAGHGAVLLYDARSDEPLGALPFGPGRVHVLRFSRDGRLLLAAGGEGATRGRVALYDVRGGLPRVERDEPRDLLLAADVREDLLQLAVGGPARLVEVRDTASGEAAFRIEAHTDWITALGFSPDGVLLASADRAGGVHLWESDSGREYLDLEGHGAAVHAVAWRRDGDLLATAAGSGHLRLFAAQDGKRTKEWDAHPGGALAVTFLPDGRLLSTGRDRTVALWGPDGKEQRRLGPLPDVGLCVAVSADGARAFAGDWTGRVHAWSLGALPPVGKPPAPAPAISSWLALPVDVDARRLESRARLAEAVAARESAARALDEARPSAESVERDARLRFDAATAAVTSATAVESAAASVVARWDLEQELVTAHAALRDATGAEVLARARLDEARAARVAAEARASGVEATRREAADVVLVHERRVVSARELLAAQESAAASIADATSAAATLVAARAAALRAAQDEVIHLPADRDRTIEHVAAAESAHTAALEQRARLEVLRAEADRALASTRGALATSTDALALARQALAQASDPALLRAAAESAQSAERAAAESLAQAETELRGAAELFESTRQRVNAARAP